MLGIFPSNDHHSAATVGRSTKWILVSSQPTPIVHHRHRHDHCRLRARRPITHNKIISLDVRPEQQLFRRRVQSLTATLNSCTYWINASSPSQHSCVRGGEEGKATRARIDRSRFQCERMCLGTRSFRTEIGSFQKQSSVRRFKDFRYEITIYVFIAIEAASLPEIRCLTFTVRALTTRPLDDNRLYVGLLSFSETIAPHSIW